MTEQRQDLINRFQKWLDTNPRKEIIAAQCANIAEKYAAEQLKLYGVVVQDETEYLLSTEANRKALFESIAQVDQLFCGECGNKRELKVETDLNSGMVCKNQLCKAK